VLSMSTDCVLLVLLFGGIDGLKGISVCLFPSFNISIIATQESLSTMDSYIQVLEWIS
jgi:hypothetical protein